MDSTYSDAGLVAGIFALLGAFMFVFFGIWLIVIISQWKLYSKAGKPGWAVIIPIYNVIVLLEIVNKPIWWIFLFLIPFVNIVIAIMLVHELSLAFGQGGGTTLLLLFLPFIGYPMLAFGSAQYVGGTPAAPAGYNSDVLDRPGY